MVALTILFHVEQKKGASAPFFNVSRGTIADIFLLKKVAAVKRLYNLTLIPSL
jgi:hypothetical protein